MIPLLADSKSSTKVDITNPNPDIVPAQPETGEAHSDWAPESLPICAPLWVRSLCSAPYNSTHLDYKVKK